MLNPFKKLFGWRTEKSDEFESDIPVQPAPARTAAYSSAVRVDVLPKPARPAPQQGQVQSMDATISLPLRSVIGRLPPELMSRVRLMDVGEAEVFVPTQKVLNQLGGGAVRISYGELRQASPPGTFSPENDRDRTLIDLPLHEILARVNPALLARRSAQRHVEVPPEIVGPFGGQMRVTISPRNGAPTQPSQTGSDTSFRRNQMQPRPPGDTAFYRNQAPPPQQQAPEPPVYSPIAQNDPRSVQPLPPMDQPIFRRNNAPAAPPAPAGYTPIQPGPTMTPRPAAVPPMHAYNRVNPPQPPARPPSIPIPDQPVFGRVQPPQPSQPVPPQPDALPDEPIFKRAPISPSTPAPTAPPVYSPIAPEPPAGQEPLSYPEPQAIPAPALRDYNSPPLSAPAPVALPTPPPEPEPIRFNPSFSPPPPPPVQQAAPAFAFAPAPAPAPAPVPMPAPAPAAPAAPSAARESIFLTIALGELAQTWPDQIRQEIVALNLISASVALPQGVIENAIKQGRVIFPWKMIRSWVKPPVSPAHQSAHDALLLEIPLKVVTPVFLASLRGVRTQKKVSVDANIPNLFNGTGLAEASAPAPAPVAPPRPPAPPAYAPAPAAYAPVATPRPGPVATPAPQPAPDTNYYVRADGTNPEDEPPPVVKKGPSPGTSFLQRYATPNEIVSKAAALNGVGGALIALPDGLLVASKIPSDFNADTLAAFLPQIFARVSQTTRELRMGELNNLNFTVGLIPWKIFRVGAIYFAAFGVAGQGLPTAQLAGIAAELDRKAK
jgi:hypothetical protein